MTTNTGFHSRKDRNGIALVIVLGLLAVLTILAVAFSIAMRIEYMAARNNANSVRAQELVHVGIARSMLRVDRTMQGECYPTKWINEAAHAWDALASEGETNMNRIIVGEAARFIANLPTSLSNDAYAAQNEAEWETITGYGGATNGRIAYVVVNLSGLIDANLACGSNRIHSTNIKEIDPDSLLSSSVGTFVSARSSHRRYETVHEMMALNGYIERPNEGFYPYSYDVDRDQFFLNYNSPVNFPQSAMPIGNIQNALMNVTEMGTRNARLNYKFDINSITKYAGYYTPWNLEGYAADSSFVANYYTPVINMFKAQRRFQRTYYDTGNSNPNWMMERPDDMIWNLVNWLDPDKVPQGEVDGVPWTHTEGGEPMPMMNEIQLRRESGSSSNSYQFAVELWYPFSPLPVQPADNFALWIGIYNKDHNTLTSMGATELNICNYAWITNWTPVGFMSFGGGLSNEFQVIKSPAFSFTNGLAIGATAENKVWFLARLFKGDLNGSTMIWNPVDEAMGFKPGNSEPDYKRRIKEFSSECGYSLTDPRSNGQVKYWWSTGESGRNIGGYGPYSLGSAWNTLGNTNYQLIVSRATLAANGITCVCNPWERKGSGLPLIIRNTTMENIGELGYIFRSNLDDEVVPAQGDFWWRTIDLMHYDEGGAFLDWMSVRSTNRVIVTNSVNVCIATNKPSYGLFALNSKQTNAVKGMLENMVIGYTTMFTNYTYKLADPTLTELAEAIIKSNRNEATYGTGKGFISFRSIWTPQDGIADCVPADPLMSGGPLAKKFRLAAQNAQPVNGAPTPPSGGLQGDIFLEEPFRRICELITFRQGMFGVIIVSQVYAADGQTVVAEKRAFATIYRDAYTGKFFIRSLKWLSDRES